MGRLEHAITRLQEMQSLRDDAGRTVGPVCGIVVTLCYLVAMLSVPVHSLSMLLWFALYPIVMSALTGEDFSHIFLMSLVALPFALMIGVFNPIYDRAPAFSVGGVEVSRGWVSYISIITRSVLSVQILLVLIRSCGFMEMCRSLRRVGVPAFLTTQLMMVYRYLTVLLEESLDMSRARQARGYGKRHLTVKMWGTFCGQLFLRTMNRAEAIHRAMLARGFTGSVPVYDTGVRRWRGSDTLMLVGWLGAFAVMRFVNLSAIFNFEF